MLGTRSHFQELWGKKLIRADSTFGSVSSQCKLPLISIIPKIEDNERNNFSRESTGLKWFAFEGTRNNFIGALFPSLSYLIDMGYNQLLYSIYIKALPDSF